MESNELESSNSKRRRSRSVSSVDGDVQIDPDLLPRKRPMPFHELDRLHYHTNLQNFGSSLQIAANAIFLGDQASRYVKVDVLLVSWEDEDPDLPVSVEVAELARVFVDIYRFDVEEWLIPADDSHIRVQTRILKFLGLSDPRHLKIVYYAGHGRLTNHGQPVWTSVRNRSKERCPTVKWSGIQNTLEESRSDVLILLDCCASGVCTTDEGNGVTELIAACAYNAIANPVGQFSFTRALITKLRKMSQLSRFTIGYLYNAVFTEAQNVRVDDPRYKKAPIHLVLSQNHDLPRSIQLSKMPNLANSTTNPTLRLSLDPATIRSSSSAHSTSLTPENSEDSSADLPATSITSLAFSTAISPDLPEYPRLLFSIRISEDIKPGELSPNLFSDWLRSVPVTATSVRVEAGFASDSTLLMVSMPAAFFAYLNFCPAIILLGSIRSKNTMLKDSQTILPSLKEESKTTSTSRPRTSTTQGMESITPISPVAPSRKRPERVLRKSFNQSPFINDNTAIAEPVSRPDNDKNEDEEALPTETAGRRTHVGGTFNSPSTSRASDDGLSTTSTGLYDHLVQSHSLTDQEKRHIVTEALKQSSVPLYKLLDIFEAEHIEPNWEHMILPLGRTMAQCRNSFKLLQSYRASGLQNLSEISPPKRQSTLETLSKYLIKVSAVEAPNNDSNKRKAGPNFLATRDIAPRPRAGSPILDFSSSGPPPRKRGRPSKKDIALKQADLIARGEILAPKKERSRPMSLFEGSYMHQTATAMPLPKILHSKESVNSSASNESTKISPQSTTQSRDTRHISQD